MITELVRNELKRIAFFIQYSGFFDNLPARTRNAIESLPVKWSKAPDFIPKDWEAKGIDWETATVAGKLDEKDFSLKIIKKPDRTEYQIFFEGNQYKVNNLEKLKSSVEDIRHGKKPKPQVMQEYFDTLFKYKSDIHDYAQKHFLAQIKPAWDLDIKKDVGHIYVRYYVAADDPKPIEERLSDHNFFRLESIIHYLKTFAKKYGLDVGMLEFKHKFIKVSGQAGFIISIK